MVSLTAILRICAEDRELRASVATRLRMIRELKLLLTVATPTTIFLLLFPNHGGDFLLSLAGWILSGQFAPSRQAGAAGDQARTALVSKIRPRPLCKHQHAVAKANQEQNVYEEPRHPGQKARDVNLTELGHCGGAADGGQASFIVVTKCGARVYIPAFWQ